ncbi:WD40 repeat domain-containing protein [Phormidesmis priestleyi]
MASLALNSNNQAGVSGALGGSNGGLFVFKDLNKDDPNLIENHGERINSVAFIGDSIINSNDDGTLEIWSQSKQPLTLKGHKGRIYSLIINYNRTSIISSGEDLTMRFWDLNTVSTNTAFKRQALLSSACDRLEKLPLLINPSKNLEKEVKRICQQILKTG